jgi:CDP-diacylglycerol--glycerol-3-phosphate 3-phosphatidyltransferase
LSGDPFHWPYLQAIALWLLVAASTITVGQRLATVYQQAKANPVLAGGPATEV